MSSVPACVAVLVLLTGWVEPAPALAAGAAHGVPWQWPLLPRPVVVRRFEAPAGPFAAGHRGVDLARGVGEPVRAAGAGVVAFAGRVAGRGVVSVDHPGGLRTTYEPVVPAVSRGDPVATGDVLGRLEVTGSHCLATPCLHWGLRRGRTYLDPLSLLPTGVRLLPVWSEEDRGPPDPLAAAPEATLDPAPVAAHGAGARPGGAAAVAAAVLAGASAVGLRLRFRRAGREAR